LKLLYYYAYNILLLLLLYDITIGMKRDLSGVVNRGET